MGMLGLWVAIIFFSVWLGAEFSLWCGPIFSILSAISTLMLAIVGISPRAQVGIYLILLLAFASICKNKKSVCAQTSFVILLRRRRFLLGSLGGVLDASWSSPPKDWHSRRSPFRHC